MPRLPLIILLVAFVVSCSSVPSEAACKMHEWETLDSVELGLSILDGVQTNKWQNGDPNHIEGGIFRMVAGEHPSSAQVWGWGAAYELALHGAISCGLPHKPAVIVAILLRLHAVTNNMKFVSIPF